jgi:archaellum component FlaG (FlaF/FlaG flagellin family)
MDNMATLQKLRSGKIITVVIALILTGTVLAISTSGLLSASQSVPYNGTISAVNLAIYSDSSLTQNCTSLSTGAVNPGGTATQTIYIKNTGTIPETLTMTVNNWNPANASSSLTLSWDRQNYVLNPGQSIQGTLTLTAVSNTGNLSTFSCSATFTGTQ